MKYKCNHCGEILTEEEESQMCDCGCPACRRDKGVEEVEDNSVFKLIKRKDKKDE